MMLTWKQWVENNSEKLLIIMRGIPGSGKSTLAKQLGKNGVVYSTDDFFINSQGEYVFNPSLLGKNHELNVNRTKEAMIQGVSPIVVDNTNINARAIKPYVYLANELGYRVEFREPETPWKFDAEELAKRNTHNVPLASIQNMIKNFDHSLTPENVLDR